MPSVKNPNGPSKNRLAARQASARKRSQKQAALGRASRVEKADRTRGAGGGLLPTSGPNRALSAKKQRKLDRAAHHALQRKLAAAGEVEMKGASAAPPAPTGRGDPSREKTEADSVPADATTAASADSATNADEDDAKAVEEQLNMDIENIA